MDGHIFVNELHAAVFLEIDRDVVGQLGDEAADAVDLEFLGRCFDGSRRVRTCGGIFIEVDMVFLLFQERGIARCRKVDAGSHCAVFLVGLQSGIKLDGGWHV